MKQKHSYEVTIGNIGNVHTGNSLRDAQKSYSEYVNQSKAAIGKAAGESVTLWRDGEPIKEYAGTLDSEAGCV